MADPRTRLDSLLRMALDGRGNQNEEANALAIARRHAEQHGLTHVVEAALKPKPQPKAKKPGRGGEGYDWSKFEEAMRRSGFSGRAGGGGQKRDGQRSGPDGATFASIKDCAEHYLRPGWRNRATGKPLTNAEVAGLVRRHFPNAKTSAASVAWYRNRMKQEGRP